MPAPVARGPSRAHQDARDGRADGKGKGKAHASASARASASVSVREGSDVGGVDRKPVKAESSSDPIATLYSGSRCLRLSAIQTSYPRCSMFYSLKVRLSGKRGTETLERHK